MAITRPYHLVIFGATGFTGKLVAEYLASNPQSVEEAGDFRWAIAGRNLAKLEAVKAGLTAGAPDLIVADSGNLESLRNMCAQTRAVVTTVGPYARYGMPLVEACVAEGTHYADLSGEVPFMRQTIDRFHEEAKQKGVRIVHSCGFDSIPSELGYHALQQRSKVLHGQFCESVLMSLLGASGSFSGGTFASLFGVLQDADAEPRVKSLLSDSYSLNPKGDVGQCDTVDFKSAYFDHEVGKWQAPFVMSSINTRIVRRGWALQGWPHGREVCYEETTATGKGTKGRLVGGFMAKAIGAVFNGGSKGLATRFVKRFAPDPGEGPNREARESGFFKMLFVGRGAGVPVTKVLLRGKRDPGYGCTSRMLSECGVLLATQPTREGGVLTPMTAFGDALVDRMERAGVAVEGV